MKSFEKAEQLIRGILIKRGCEILVSNFRRRGCELDLVATKDRNLYIVEVKYCRRPVVHAYQIKYLMNRPKRNALVRGCEIFKRTTYDSYETTRFDLAVVSQNNRVQYFPNVFEY